jgi:hypothetical protein
MVSVLRERLDTAAEKLAKRTEALPLRSLQGGRIPSFLLNKRYNIVLAIG